MSTRVAREHTIVLLVSPNFGIVDSWLPALDELKRRDPAVRIVALFAKKERIVSQAHPEDLLTQLVEPLLDGVVFQTWYGPLVFAASLAQANEIIRRQGRPKLLYGVIDRLERHAVTRWWAAALERLAKAAAARSFKKHNRITLEAMADTVRAVCYDVSEEKLGMVKEAQRVFEHAGWFSLPHGIDTRTFATTFAGAHAEGRRPEVAVTAYLSSRDEIGAYREGAGLPERSLKVVGVPRHAPSWSRRVQQRSVVPRGSGRPYIFLVSRPANAAFLPRTRKLEAVRDVHKLAAALDYDVIVRLHPKERDEGIYNELLASPSERSAWSVSALHPFVIGASAAFSITFFSSVAVDMIALGVPAIERCDFTGLTEARQLVRDATGRPISVYHAQGLVLPARTYDELSAHARRICADRDEVVRELQKRYAQIYETVDDPIGLIADDIGNSLRQSSLEPPSQL